MKNFNYFIFLNSIIFFKLVFANNQIKENLGIDTIDFWQSMDINSEKFKRKYANPNNKKILDDLAKLWEKNNFFKIKPANTPKIPKIIHQIWVGPKPIPKFFKRFQKTWLDNHPDWEYKLWTDENVKNLKLHNRKFYDKTNDYIEKANILRYEVLYKFGGVYVDVDFESLKSLEFLIYYYDFFVGISPHDIQPVINNAIIASIPNHKILEEVITNIEFKPTNRLERTGMLYFSKHVTKLIYNENGVNIALPTKFFYAIPKNYNPKEINKYIYPESLALHYWNSGNPSVKIE